MTTKPTTMGILHKDELLFDYLERTNTLSGYDGDLQKALDENDTVIIDIDYVLSDMITIGSGKSLRTNNGATVIASGGSFTTPTISPQQYYKDTNEAQQIPITSDALSGSSVIQLSDASGLSVGDKLVIKNGYCDMWRVLESGDAAIQRRAVDTLTYKSEIVEVLSVSGNSVTVSNLVYDYPLVPTTYGYIQDENSLPGYSGYNRPSATKLKFKDISLDLKIEIPSGITNTVIHMSYVDGLKLKLQAKSSAEILKPVLISMCDNVEIPSFSVKGHKGGFLWMQETTRGVINHLECTDWKGGHDSPFCVMLLSCVTANNVSVSASVKRSNSSAFYYNTCDGGSVTNVYASNLARVVDASFSRAIVSSGVFGKNCDLVYGAFCSSNCILTDGTVDGYCFQNANTTIYTATLIYCLSTTNVLYSNIKRLNDKGYGRVRIGGCIGLVLNNIFAPKTHMHAVIASKGVEVATGANNKQVNVESCHFGGLTRESTYYDSADEFGYSYPLSRYKGVLISNGGGLSLGGSFNPADSYEITSNSVCEIGGGVFGVSIKGLVGSITTSTGNKATCFPDVSDLRLLNKPNSGVFSPVDTMMGDGSVWSTNFVNGAKVSDVYSRKTYINGSNKGSAPSWVQA